MPQAANGVEQPRNTIKSYRQLRAAFYQSINMRDEAEEALERANAEHDALLDKTHLLEESILRSPAIDADAVYAKLEILECGEGDERRAALRLLQADLRRMLEKRRRNSR